MSDEKLTRIGDGNSVAERLARVRGLVRDLQSRTMRATGEATSGSGVDERETPAQALPSAHLEPTLPLAGDEASVASVATPAVSDLEAHRRRIANLTPIIFTAPTPTPTRERAPWPAPLTEEALYGLSGDIVRTLEPHTEADPAAILIQTLVAYGNVVGSSPYFQVEGSAHHTNLFANLVGATSKARKGTSWGQVRRILAASAEPIAIDRIWHEDAIKSGLSSGEGLIWEVRDSTGSEGEEIGVLDKRTMVVENEFGRPLVAMAREGNILSEVLRESWDSGNLQIMNKNSPAKATGAHISIIGHITCDDLRRNLRSTDQANGFANRFLWIGVRRSKMLPEGGNLSDDAIAALSERLRHAISFGSRVGLMRRDEPARTLWREQYETLSEGRLGLLGSITSRAEAQVLRLSMIYALLDLSDVIRGEHLRAALAVWRYSEDSARYIFGDSLGDPVADTILTALRNSGPTGLTRTDIRDIFGRHKKDAQIPSALVTLEALGLARVEHQASGGRPVERWFSTNLVAT
jgi:hypothetical protein